MAQFRPSARTWRLVAAIGFWALVAIAVVMRGAVGLALAYVAGLWLLGFSLMAWRRQDEYARAAQKFSWVFGGLFGLFASLAFLPVLLQPGVLAPLLGWLGDVLETGDPSAPAFLLGAVYLFVGQLIGFLVCWVGWHIAKR